MDKTQVISAQDKVEKISKITLWVLIGISLVVLALFLLVGYDTPYEENPKQVAPQLTDLLIIWTYILIIATAVAAIGAVIYGFVSGGNKSKHEEVGLASKAGHHRLGHFLRAQLSSVSSLVHLPKTKCCSSTVSDWNDPTDIILTDTSMISILILTIVTIIATVFSMVTNKK